MALLIPGSFIVLFTRLPMVEEEPDLVKNQHRSNKFTQVTVKDVKVTTVLKAYGEVNFENIRNHLP